jgi:hypothetical protein
MLLKVCGDAQRIPNGRTRRQTGAAPSKGRSSKRAEAAKGVIHDSEQQKEQQKGPFMILIIV